MVVANKINDDVLGIKKEWNENEVPGGKYSLSLLTLETDCFL